MIQLKGIRNDGLRCAKQSVRDQPGGRQDAHLERDTRDRQCHVLADRLHIGAEEFHKQQVRARAARQDLVSQALARHSQDIRNHTITQLL